MVDNATTLYGLRTEDQLVAWMKKIKSVRQAARRLGMASLDIGPLDETAPPAFAFVNDGRWIAQCPTLRCPGAIDLIKGAAFLCPSCLNIEIEHRLRPVEWPADVEGIEAALDGRLLPNHRAWVPGETVVDLQVENTFLVLRHREGKGE